MGNLIKEVQGLKESEEVIIPKEILDKSKDTTSALRRISDKGDVNIENLSPSEIEKYSRLNSSLNIRDINSVSNFGSELQGTMTKYSNDFLNAVRTSKCGEIGTLIDNLLTELGYIDIDDLAEPNSFKKFVRKIPILNKLLKSVEKIIKKYDTIAKNVDDISQKITSMRMLALRDNNALQTMFNNNMVYGSQIEELIIAGKIKLNEIDNKLNEMQEHSENYDAHEIQDVQTFKNNLERRLNDMLILRYVIKQSLPQIRTVQYNNIAIADKAQSIIATTIPVWRNQLSIAVALHNQKNSITAQRKITDTTNQILLKNAELLKENSVYAAKENERTVIDVETLRQTTSKLIETIREVKQIHEEAAKNRHMTEIELQKVERDLEAAMTSASAKITDKVYIEELSFPR